MSKTKGKKNECEFFSANPGCPFIQQIKHSEEDIIIIKKALVGDDYQGGIVARIGKIEAALKKRFSAKDLASLIVAAAALISALVALLK